MLVSNILQWAGYIERMADNRLQNRAAELRVEGRRRRVRPMLRWQETHEGGKDYHMRR